MRSILFRGKSIKTGEWQYGGIVHQTDLYGMAVDRYFIIDGTTTQDYDIGYECEVVPKTVGQFTGLVDKNGKKIFEGDVVRSYSDISNMNKEYLVEWNEPYAGFTIRLSTSQTGLHYMYIDECITNMCVVIGSIHDNPELVSEQSEDSRVK